MLFLVLARPSIEHIKSHVHDTVEREGGSRTPVSTRRHHPCHHCVGKNNKLAMLKQHNPRILVGSD